MAETATIAPASALEGSLSPRTLGRLGEAGAGVRLSERPVGALWQVAAWPGHLDGAVRTAAKAAGASAAPGPGEAVAGSAALLLRTEPLKWLILSDGQLEAPAVPAGEGTALDLSHARTRIRVEGPETAALMARLVPLDLRETAFPDGRVAATGLHHVGVTLMRREGGIELLVPRTFALSLWEHLLEVAAQFGVEVA